MVCSGSEHHLPRGWNQFDIHVVRGALIAHGHTIIYSLLSSELPRWHLSVSLTGISDLMNIFLTFMSISGCIVHLHYQRILSFGRLLPQRFLSSQFNYSLMWVNDLVPFPCSSSILIMFGPRIVGCKLGMHFDWLHRAPVLAISLLVLQIWCQNTSA